MLMSVAGLPGVTLLDRSRITAVDLDSQQVSVRIASPSGETVLRPQLLVAADGSSSAVSRLAGLAESRHRVSTLFGLLLHDKALPDAGYGHVFLGGSGPVLAYPVSKSAVRVMFDVPDTPAGPRRLDACYESLHAIPEPLRDDVAEQLKRPGIIASASYTAAAREVNRGRLVLVGDAAGCCHPITATGLTVCMRDALRLRDALRDTGGDLERALPLYALRRRAPQRTRLLLARGLYEMFCAQTPESRLMRDGLREYWNGSRERRTRSMALLSAEEDRLRLALWQLAKVMLCGFGTRLSAAWHGGEFSPRETRVLLGLSRMLLRYANDTLRIS
jgi:2-polyprenyl-6-methoxyphenol hydroxylase-like FAD-dependent oxidoreductase